MFPKRAFIRKAQPQRCSLTRLIPIVAFPLYSLVMKILETEFHQQVIGGRCGGGALESGCKEHVTDLYAAVRSGDVKKADYGDCCAFF